MPILSGFSSLFTLSDSIEVKKRATEVLFAILRENRHRFTSIFWEELFASLLRPLFDSLMHVFAQSHTLAEDLYQQMRRRAEQVFSEFTDLLILHFNALRGPCFAIALDVYASTLRVYNDYLSNISVHSLSTLLESTGQELTRNEWDSVLQKVS
jgi:hypothetical protein